MNTMTTPTPQWRQALDRANAVKDTRARLRAAVEQGERSLVPILRGDIDDPDEAVVIDAMKIDAILQWAPGVGLSTARRIRFDAGLTGGYYGDVTLGRLGADTRLKLSSMYDERTRHYIRRAA